MPTYEYECEGCGYEFEQFQPITARPLRKCPECGERKLRRLIGGGGALLFKGSGFYETDYRSDSYKKAAEAEQKAASGGSGDKKKKEKKGTSESGSKKTPAKQPDSRRG